ncbi:splicing factor, suppressor of white-apricot homolog isoform X2 [Coccinella septempunctata]|nr:splicing factor, suppressor of white-apricot homolog isoform X2 [Coccinella septempunctata]
MNNEEEEEMYKEEELKRNKTNEFQYSYDVPKNPDEKELPSTVLENEIEEKYEPSPDLDVPVDIQIPRTVKEYARIEKTAIFVSTQGPQMEILIKAKQSDNPQFSFLNQNDPLYKFYRHVLDAVKNRRYRSSVAKSDSNTANTSTDENGDHYLHPSLVSSASSSTEVQPTIPSIPYRPNANCAYSQLVSRIQGTTIAEVGTHQTTQIKPAENQDVHKIQEDGVQVDMSTLTYEQQQQYYQYYMQRQYYEYYKQLLEKSGVSSDALSHPDQAMNPSMQAFLQQMMYAQYLQQSQQQQPTNPYAQIVSNLSKEMSNFNPSVETPDISKEPVIYSEKKDNPPSAIPNPQTLPKEEIPVSKNSKPSESPKKAALSLIQNYASDSEEENSENEEKVDDDFKIPDEETKVVIDKMACYVVKNGEDFEKIVKSREDPRFVFLKEDHEFHPYYRRKVEEERRKMKEAAGQDDDKAESKEVSTINPGKMKEKKVIAPVSFSIKKPKEDPPKEIKSALPVDEETDEEEVGSQEAAAPLAPVIPQPPTLVTSNVSKKVFKIESSSIAKEKESKPNIPQVNDNSQGKFKKTEVNEDENKTAPEDEKIVERVIEQKHEKEEKINSPKKNDVLHKDDPVLEMIDLTEDERNIDLVKNADIFDLSPDKEKTARENRALQLERRRKALAFLKLKSASHDSDQVPDSGKPTILTIDLSNIQSPKKKYISSDSSDEDKRRHRKRSRSRNKEADHHRSKRSKESEKTPSRKDREKYRKSRTPKVERNIDSGVSDKEEGEMSDDTDDTKHRKSYKKKKSHKRKHSKSKHSSKSKKKSKKKEREVSSSPSDSGASTPR